MNNQKLFEIIRKSAIAYMQDSFYYAEKFDDNILYLWNDKESKRCATMADYCFCLLECFRESLVTYHDGLLDDYLRRNIIHYVVLYEYSLGLKRF